MREGNKIIHYCLPGQGEVWVFAELYELAPDSPAGAFESLMLLFASRERARA